MGRPEDERVKIPALVHLTRLDYEYVSLKKGIAYDGDINIFVDTFRVALNRINAISLSETETQAIVQDFKVILGTDDLGRKFYNHLLRGYNGIKLIDFEHPERNTFQFATELPCINGNEEFRPDITILINGMPLAFVEVKRPNNMDGIQAEYDRMNKRVRNKKFRRFINITQLIVFSNNGEYDDSEAAPLEGAFYATASYNRLFFSHFREQDQTIYQHVSAIAPDKEAFILKDTNLPAIKHAPGYATTIDPTVIVGWYEDATVLRFRKKYSDGHMYSIIAQKAVLLPEILRTEKIPRARDGGFGFGQSNLRYPVGETASEAVRGVLAYIDGFKGDNTLSAATDKAIASLSDEKLMKLAGNASPDPAPKYIATTTLRKRNPFLPEMAKRRANGVCELCGGILDYKTAAAGHTWKLTTLSRWPMTVQMS